jgi:hypothetical protein
LPVNHWFAALLHWLIFLVIEERCSDPSWYYIVLGVGSECEYYVRIDTLVACCYLGAFGILCYVYVLWKRMESPVGNDRISLALSYLVSWSDQPRVPSQAVRSNFNKCPGVVNRQASDHTHGQSAKVRNDASSFMDLFARLIGMPAYFIQSSPADARHNRKGCRTYHWSKDLGTDFSAFVADPDNLNCIVDVDMYLDMPHLLSACPQTYLLSTFQPSSVAQSTGEYTFTFNSENEVIYKVSGGATYQHPVWNYASDTLLVKHSGWFFTDYTSYNVDKRQTDSHHQLVLLTPVRKISVPLITIDRWIGGNILKRLCVVERVEEREYLRMRVMTTTGMKISTGKPNALACATIFADQDDTLASLSRIGNTKLQPAQVKSTLDDCDGVIATILTEYHREESAVVPDVVYPVAQSVYRYQFYPMEYSPDVKQTLIPFMSPVAVGCYAPDSCKSNDKAFVQGRILDVKPADTEVSASMLAYMQEFIELLIPEEQVGSGHPVDLDTVYDKQARPSQRAILNSAALSARSSSKQPIQSFVKKEAYGSPNDPRGISTVPGVNKLNYSRFMYAFTEVLRATCWYAFALSPLAIATRVVEICMHALRVICTDLSRFDGRVSRILRMLEHMAMMRFFAKEYHAHLAELMATQKNQRAYTTYGVKYDTGESRASGSAETADFNSMDNAFMAYVDKRTTIVNGRFLSPQEAWDALGLYGGDDGLTADSNPEHYTNTCKGVGQVLTAEIYERGQFGVNFLARLYGPDVWHGAMDSMCDVKRQLTKFHATTCLPPSVTPIQKFAEKAVAFAFADRNTPIIGEMACCFLENFPDVVPEKLGAGNMRGVASYSQLAPENVQYPNEDSGWMVDTVMKQMPTFDFEKFHKWLSGVAANKELILRPPVCITLDITHVAKAKVVVDGDLVVPKQPERPKLSPLEYADMRAAKALVPCSRGDKCFGPSKCWFKHVSV